MNPAATGETPTATPLWALGRGAAACIFGYTDQLDPAYRTRLAEMGFHPGEQVRCVLRPALGAPRMYRVSNTVYSLDRELAECILVTPA
ncbi:MAG: ferrous iron transport protein A [Gammaproteobacteria bacterium HGW-Gammaproteobacteria-8]|nr:MAG: ferrous iron transport protein A [Gammaproteobacteria bacterium HGW-Gammaproteobacteria-8]